MNQFPDSVGAFRDIGIQVFDTFKATNWEHSYAIMVGNGNGLNYGDNDGNKDVYLYWSSERVFGGKGRGVKVGKPLPGIRMANAPMPPTVPRNRTVPAPGSVPNTLKNPFG